MPNISYIKKGEGDIVLLLHGWGQNKEIMLPLIEEMKNKYTCVLIDMPGFGETEFHDFNTISEYTEYIRLFLEKNKILPKYIIGHSFGGKVAVDYYLKYGDIDKIVVVSSPLLKPTRGLKYYYKVFKYKIKKKLKIKQSNEGSSDYKNCKDNMKKFFVKVVNTHYNKEVSKIKIPVLLIWGDKDKQVPINKAVKLHKKIKTNKLIILNGGHFAHLENIEFTRLNINDFLRRKNYD